MLNIEEIYKKLSPPIFRYLYRLTGSSQEAEELTQETFYRMLKSIYRFRQDASLTTWLYKIAFNTYQEWKRKKGIYCFRYGFDLSDFRGEQTEDPVLQLEKKENVSLIKEALFMLSEMQRVTLILRDLEGLSYQQISEITGKSLAWVKVTLFRARANFREIYSRLGEG